MTKSIRTSPPAPFAPAALGQVRLRNRIIKAATFEGMSPANVVSATLIDFHRRVAAGGAAMTTVSYLAVSRDGRGAPNEVYIHDAAADGLAEIASAVHAEGAAISAQLGHAGAVGTIRKRYLGPSKTRTMLGTWVQPISAAEIDAVVGQFADGAAMLAQAGFDAVELHFGHHYLVSAFLSPRWNRRTDDYGGPVENRARLALRILRAVADRVGDTMAVTAKVNMTDGIRGGLQVADSIEVARLLEAEGMLAALELSAGGSQANQMFMFRGDPPRQDMAAALPGAQGLAFRLRRPGTVPALPLRRGVFPADGTAVPRRADTAADPARRDQHARLQSSWPWPRASTSSRWAGRCCASLTWSPGWRLARRSRAPARTATSACPASTPAPAACSIMRPRCR